MSARTELAAALTTALPTYRVMAYNTTLDAITKPTIMLWQSTVAPAEQVGLGRLLVTLDLWVLTGQEDPEKASDALDANLEEVLAALQPITWIAWSLAERGILLDVFHGYKITATAVAEIGA